MLHILSHKASLYASGAVTLLMLLLLPVLLFDGMAGTVLYLTLCFLLWLHFRGWEGTRALAGQSLLVGGVMLAWPLCSALWSLTPLVSVVTALRVAGLCACGWFVAGLTARGEAFPVLWGRAFITGGVIAVAMLCTEFAEGQGVFHMTAGLFDMNYYRFINKNLNRGLCALAVLAWPAIGLLYGAGRRIAAFALVALLIAGLCVLNSTSAQLAVIVSLVAFCLALYAPRRVSGLPLYAAGALLLLWPVLFYTGEQAFRETLYDRLDDSSQHRIEIWHFAFGKWAEKPALGWGIDTSRVMPGGEREVRPGLASLPMHTHNAPIQLLLELGAVGYLLAVACIWFFLHRMARRDYRLPADRAMVYGSLISYLTIGFFAFNIWQTWWLGVGMIAWVLCALFTRRRNVNNC